MNFNISKTSVKDKQVFLWTVKEAVIMMLTGVFLYMLLKKNLGEINTVLLTITVVGIEGGMFVEMPNGLSTLDYIKRYSKYNKLKKSYYYLPYMKGAKMYEIQIKEENRKK